MRKLLLVAIALIAAFAATAAATPVVTVVSPGLDGNFLGTGTTGIVFQVHDDNTTCAMYQEYDVNIGYKSSRTGTVTMIVSDLNLGDTNRSSDCNQAIAHNCSMAPVSCSYTWTEAGIETVADGNYYIDINVSSWYTSFTGSGFDSGNDAEIIGSFGMDSNVSLYIDNTPPVCNIVQTRGNRFNWEIENEGAPDSQGSQTTIYYDAGEGSYSSTVALKLEDILKNARNTYRCYATDSAGNTGLTTKGDITYPSQDNVTIFGPGGGAVTQPGAMAIAGVPTTPAEAIEWAQANPVFIGIALVAGYLLLAKGGKARKRKRR